MYVCVYKIYCTINYESTTLWCLEHQATSTGKGKTGHSEFNGGTDKTQLIYVCFKQRWNYIGHCDLRGLNGWECIAIIATVGCDWVATVSIRKFHCLKVL